MRRGKHVTSTRLEDCVCADEMRHEIVRVQVLDHLVADRGIVPVTPLEVVEMDAIRHGPPQRTDGQQSTSDRARA